MSREAELERPSRVACSDLLDHVSSISHSFRSGRYGRASVNKMPSTATTSPGTPISQSRCAAPKIRTTTPPKMKQTPINLPSALKIFQWPVLVSAICDVLNVVQRPELRHAGGKAMNREAELERPSRVACSDLLGVICVMPQ